MRLAVLVAVGMITAAPAEARRHAHYGGHHTHGHHGGLAHVNPRLAAKVRQVVGACHAHVVSGLRPGARIAGSGRRSRHASGQAVDVSGNYRCIYAHLRGWPSYSLDGPRMRHVHISLGEGHFYHHGGRHHGHRYAGRGHRYVWRGWRHRRGQRWAQR